MKFWQIIVLIIIVAAIGVGISVWQPWKTSTKNVTVNGIGKVKDSPNVAQIYGGVESKKASAQEAQSEVSGKISKIIDLLKEKGIEEKDIKTTQISSTPNYNYADGRNTQDGYVANTTINVTIRDIKRGQEILDLMTTNGITNLYGPSLTFSDEKFEELKAKAREKAVIDAKNKADALAKAGGTKVGKVITISEDNTNSGTIMPYAVGALSSDAIKASSGTIQPGEDEVTVQVTVCYRLK